MVPTVTTITTMTITTFTVRIAIMATSRCVIR